MLDNQDVAVLTKLNDLAERRGLKTYDFVAVMKREKDSYVLDFELPASGNALREERFDKMLKDLGIVVDDRAALKGETSDLIDAIDKAIAMSPRNRVR